MWRNSTSLQKHVSLKLFEVSQSILLFSLKFSEVLHVFNPYIVVFNSWFSFLWLFNDNVVSTIFILTIVTQFFFQPILQIDKSRTPKNILVITSGKCKKIHLWWNFSRYRFILKGKMYKKKIDTQIFLTIYVVYID